MVREHELAHVQYERATTWLAPQTAERSENNQARLLGRMSKEEVLESSGDPSNDKKSAREG